MIGKEILNYRIIQFIGAGGMGAVYLAENKFISKQKVAVKVIKANMANSFTRQLLKDEAEKLAELNHPNIVAFHNYHIDEEGNIYLIMEYADGKDLDTYIRNVSGLIVENRICPLFEPILDGVGYAHKHGILHRDHVGAFRGAASGGLGEVRLYGRPRQPRGCSRRHRQLCGHLPRGPKNHRRAG